MLEVHGDIPSGIVVGMLFAMLCAIGYAYWKERQKPVASFSDERIVSSIADLSQRIEVKMTSIEKMIETFIRLTK